MYSSTKSMRIGAILSFLLMALVVSHTEDFLAAEEWGKTMFFSAIGASFLVFPGVALKLTKPDWLRGLFLVAMLGVAPLVMMIAVERLNGNFISGFLTKYDALENYVVYLLIYLLVFGLSGSVRTSVSLVSPIFLLFGVANMYIKEFKGSPLVPMDFSSIRTAGNVAAGYTYEIGYEIVLGVCLTAMLIALCCRQGMPRHWRPFRYFLRIMSLFVVLGFALVFYKTDTVADYGLKPDFFNQTRGYTNHGAVLQFTLNTKYLWLAEPSGYDADKVDDIISKSVDEGEANILETALVRQGMAPEEAKNYIASFETAGEQGITPNLIVVMNESFSDLSVVGDFETNMPYLSYIDSIRDETIQGNVYVSTIGTGTSNTEFEFLTGNTMAFLPAGSNAYQLYVEDTQPSLVSVLESRNYSALALHPYFESSWNRPAVYEAMGFDDFISVEDIIDEDIIDRYKSSGYSYTLYKRLLKSRYHEDILLRRFVSDAYNFKTVQRLYEERDPSKPFFLFNVTMQNHSSYNQDYDNFNEEVYLTSTAKEYEKTNQYLSLIKVTDEAFADLVSYFDAVEEPTMILMFGDHQPFIEDSFYSEVMGQSIADMDDETQQKQYITRFVLWANYDIPSGWVDEISMNYLSTLLMQVAGLERTDYSKYLANLYTRLPVITSMGCRDSDGNFFQADENNSLKSEIAAYRIVQYNNITDVFHRSSAFQLGGGEDGD